MHCVDLGESFPTSFFPCPFFSIFFSKQIAIPTSIYYLLATFGFNTAENEPCKVCPLSVYRSSRSFCRLGSSLSAYGALAGGGDGAIGGNATVGDELSVRSREANELFVLENE